MSDSPEEKRVSAYLATIDRLEPDIAMIDHDAGIASIAISLKRLADGQQAIKEAIQNLDVAIQTACHVIINRA